MPRRPRFRSKIEGPVGGPNTIHIGDESGWQTERFIYTAKKVYFDKVCGCKEIDECFALVNIFVT